jgi:hypothetical protein
MNRREVSLKLAPLMPDEHIFSGLIRSYLLSGYKDFANGLRALSVRVNYPLKSDDVFSEDFAKIVQQYCHATKYQPLNILKQHSLYSIFSVGSPFRFNSNINETLKLGKSPYVGIWKKRYDLAYSKDWKFCDCCIKDDIKKFGFSYWHCSHQIPTVSTCTVHNIALSIAVNQKGQKLAHLNEFLLPQQIIDFSVSMVSDNTSSWDRWLVKLCQSLKGKDQFYAQDAKSKIFSYLNLPKKSLLPEDIEFRFLKFDKRLLQPKLLPYELVTVKKVKSKEVLTILEKFYGFEVLSKLFKQYSPKGRIITAEFKDITREPLSNIGQKTDHPIPYLLLLFAIRLCPETLRIKYE